MLACMITQAKCFNHVYNITGECKEEFKKKEIDVQEMKLKYFLIQFAN